MSKPVEPPTVDEKWGQTVEPVDSSDWDREFFVATARDVCNIDADVLADKPTEWIIGRINEQLGEYGR